MSLVNRLRSLYRSLNPGQPPRSRHTLRRVFLERLENRQLLASFNPSSVPELVAAIDTANTNSESDTIDLGAATFSLTAVNNTTIGFSSGLPVILSDAGNELTIRNGTIARDTDAATPQFGILHISGGADLTLDDVNVTGGEGRGFAGGIFNGGTLSVINSTVSNNVGIGATGGIHNGGTLVITNSTVSGNFAFANGGGISSHGALTITNSTISGNATDVNGKGGGMYLGNTGTHTITNSTISGNSASRAGGVYFYGADALLSNTIVAGNTATGVTTTPDIDIRGPGTRGDHNLIGATSEAWVGSNNLIGTLASPIDPQLIPLRDNGGLTETHALRPGSPAIDAADPNHFPSTDQRGVARPQEGGPDIGAYESDGTVEPAVLIELVIADVEALNLQQGLENSLDQKLTTAQEILEDLNENNDGAAVNKLHALINQVEAQRGNQISEEDADNLIAATWIILELLGEEQP